MTVTLDTCHNTVACAAHSDTDTDRETHIATYMCVSHKYAHIRMYVYILVWPDLLDPPSTASTSVTLWFPPCLCGM